MPDQTAKLELTEELQTFEARRQELIGQQHEGDYVLIRGKEVAGVFAAYEDALREGYERFGLDPFLVKKVESVETILHFT